MNKSESKPGIVLNRMFVGDYLTSNLGHEIINLFQADNGNHYLYLNPYGNFDKSHKDKIGIMLMVKSVGGNVVEVIGMAKNIEAVVGVDQPYQKYEKGQDSDILKKQLDLIEKEQITYGGVPLNEIFNDAEQQTIFLTYKAKAGDVLVPKEGHRIFIQYGKNDKLSQAKSANDRWVVVEGHKFPSTSLKSYIYPNGEWKGEESEERQKDYEKILNEIILAEDLWTTERDWKVKVDEEVTERKPNLFEICQIQNDENRLSNALAYFMVQPEFRELWKDFFHSLGISLLDGFTVEREADARIKATEGDKTIYKGGGRIDLLIKDKENVIVIENKIKSGINSKESDDKDMNQLDRYVNFVESEKESEFKELTPHYFILTPTYNVPDPSKVNNHFSILTYKRLYDFLSEGKNKEIVEQDDNFKVFRDTLYRHTLPTPNAYLFHEMLEKFQNRINGKKTSLWATTLDRTSPSIQPRRTST